MWFELAKMQKELNDRIIKEKGLENQPLYKKYKIGLLTELGELANEIRFFKHWSDHQKPYDLDSVLEEYVDGLHFILTFFIIRYDMNYLEGVLDEVGDVKPQTRDNFEDAFDELFILISTKPMFYIHDIFELYLGVGEMLGYSHEKIKIAYKRKNAINHHRQEVDY